MRMLALLPPLFVATACNVSTDSRNDQVTVNTAGIANAAGDIADRTDQAVSDVGNSVEGTGERIENAVDNLDIDVDVGRNEDGNSQ